MIFILTVVIVIIIIIIIIIVLFLLHGIKQTFFSVQTQVIHVENGTFNWDKKDQPILKE